ncbi:scrFIAM [Symbiodinium sp. CCMP2592]|nr:scrFIAM [Symbiodinium sp. CCMP2592]
MSHGAMTAIICRQCWVMCGQQSTVNNRALFCPVDTRWTMAPKSPKMPMKAMAAMKAMKTSKPMKAMAAMKAMKTSRPMKAMAAHGKMMKAMKTKTSQPMKAMAAAMKAMKTSKPMKATKAMAATKPKAMKVMKDQSIQCGIGLYGRPDWAQLGLTTPDPYRGEDVFEVNALEEGRWVCSIGMSKNTRLDEMVEQCQDPGCNTTASYRALGIAVSVERVPK